VNRIALISEHASPACPLGSVDSGGQNVYVGELARALGAGGHAVDVFTRRDDPTLPEVVEWSRGVRLVHVPAGPAATVPKEELLPFMAAFRDFVLRFIRGERPRYDLVHANFWMSGWVAAEIRRELGLPFVVTFHALGRVRRFHQREADHFPEERIAIEERIVAEADRVIAECPQDEQDLIALYDADPARIAVVPCGFDPSEMWPVPRSLARFAIGVEPHDRIVLQLGRLVPRKGIDNVIEALALVRRRRSFRARLLVVGGAQEDARSDPSPELARLRRIASDEGVADAVTFVGRRCRQILKYFYSAADVFVTTPWYEPFGITPLEAMACGTPVVGANVGGIKFSVVDGETGFLVAPKDPEALADRLVHLFENPAVARRQSRAALRRLHRLFTWKTITEAMLAVYRDVESAPRPSDGLRRVSSHGRSSALRSTQRISTPRGTAGALTTRKENRR
jgi:glycosyltransferase involved in cell wall biosynthesis